MTCTCEGLPSSRAPSSISDPCASTRTRTRPIDRRRGAPLSSTSRDAPQVDEIGAKARHRGQLRGARAVKSSTVALVSAGCSSGGRNAFLAHGGDVAARGKRFLPPTARFGSRFLGTRKSSCDCVVARTERRLARETSRSPPATESPIQNAVVYFSSATARARRPRPSKILFIHPRPRRTPVRVELRVRGRDKDPTRRPLDSAPTPRDDVASPSPTSRARPRLDPAIESRRFCARRRRRRTARRRRRRRRRRRPAPRILSRRRRHALVVDVERAERAG